VILATTSIDRLGLAVRTAAALKCAGLVTFADVARLSAADLAEIAHFTPACFDDLLGVVAERWAGNTFKWLEPPRFLPAAELRRRLHRQALALATERDRLATELEATDRAIAANRAAAAQLEGEA
jgi:hypothetical protein